MKCRQCGTEIADKALICFRCGAATAAPRVPPPAERPTRGPLPLLATAIAIILAAALLVPPLPDGGPEIGGWAAAALALVVAVWRLRPVSKSHGRWRR